MSTLRLQILHSLRETEEEKAPDHFMLYARPFAVNAVHLNVSTLRLEMCITLKTQLADPHDFTLHERRFTANGAYFENA